MEESYHMKPFSTYPEDRAALLDMAGKVLYEDDTAAAQGLANLVREILLDEGYVLDRHECGESGVAQ
jgi:hypothetical protein